MNDSPTMKWLEYYHFYRNPDITKLQEQIDSLNREIQSINTKFDTVMDLIIRIKNNE